MFSIGYAFCLHSMGLVDIMISPAKEGWQLKRQYFDTESLKGQKNDTENRNYICA